uniref:Uncharacterized protein n=1 Tax=Arundo donax TaxID=35708 RepID=A0A0A8YB18_ARUDO
MHINCMASEPMYEFTDGRYIVKPVDIERIQTKYSYQATDSQTLPINGNPYKKY